MHICSQGFRCSFILTLPHQHLYAPATCSTTTIYTYIPKCIATCSYIKYAYSTHCNNEMGDLSTWYINMRCCCHSLVGLAELIGCWATGLPWQVMQHVLPVKKKIILGNSSGHFFFLNVNILFLISSWCIKQKVQYMRVYCSHLSLPFMSCVLMTLYLSIL